MLHCLGKWPISHLMKPKRQRKTGDKTLSITWRLTQMLEWAGPSVPHQRDDSAEGDKGQRYGVSSVGQHKGFLRTQSKQLNKFVRLSTKLRTRSFHFVFFYINGFNRRNLMQPILYSTCDGWRHGNARLTRCFRSFPLVVYIRKLCLIKIIIPPLFVMQLLILTIRLNFGNYK